MVEKESVNVFILKRVLKIFFTIIFLLVAIVVMQNCSISSKAKHFPVLTDTTNLRTDFNLILNTERPRNYLNVDVLDTVATRIENEFAKYTDKVSLQKFEVSNNEYKNIIASFGKENASRIIVGAHYDVCGNQDGADDNASGVVGLIELARLLKDKKLNNRIDLVAYTLEEPPFFATEKMGSYIHAKSLKDSNTQVKGMVSLEMIGYFSEENNSQHYPMNFLKWFYGDKGNFILIAQKSFRGKFARKYKQEAFKNNSIITKSFRVPSSLGGIDLSDHRNYWKFGYSAVMVTNTSFFRNKNYHQETDKLETLNLQKMGLVIDDVYRTLIAIDSK